jgi:hypothetical protein
VSSQGNPLQRVTTNSAAGQDFDGAALNEKGDDFCRVKDDKRFSRRFRQVDLMNVSIAKTEVDRSLWSRSSSILHKMFTKTPLNLHTE